MKNLKYSKSSQSDTLKRKGQEYEIEENSIKPSDKVPFLLRALVTSPCQEACPVQLHSYGYISLIEESKFEESYKVVRQRLPFPRILGRVCNHPCESTCRRGQMDEAVAVIALERFVADYAHDKGIIYKTRIKPGRKETVAIVGAGPAGLAAAYDLAREGFKVTVFEALPTAGGMLAFGCPTFRLPGDVLEDEITNVTELGVEIKCNHRVTDIDSLFQEGYSAIFIAVGAHQGQKLPVPGADLEGVFTGTSFLRNVASGNQVKLGSRVLVIGGGGVALDCARTAVRLGIGKVGIICLESRKDMPADPDEITVGEAEGVVIYPSRTITNIMSENKRIVGVECLDLRSMRFDNEGKLHLSAIEGSEHILPADTVVFAVGQTPDLAFLSGKLTVNKGGLITVNSGTLETEIPGVFAGGDAATNAGSVAQAIADGQRAALSITAYLNGEKPYPGAQRQDDEVIAFPTVDASERENGSKRPRVKLPLRPVEQRGNSFAEVVLNYSAKQAVEEASRCLRCDLVRPAKIMSAERYGATGTLEEQFERNRREGQYMTGAYYRKALCHNLGLGSRRNRTAENVVILSCGFSV